MLAFIVRRLIISVLVLFGISVLLFAMLRWMPGDPTEALLDPLTFTGDREAALAALRGRLGLDRSLPVQYLAWLREVFQGNLGFSYVDGRPVTEILFDRLAATMRLMTASVVIGLMVGVPLGIIAAIRKNSLVDYFSSAGSLLMISVPSFFTALVGIYVFGIKLGWLPTSGQNTPGETGLLDSLKHLILPATILGLSLAGPYMRYVRSSLLEVLSQDFLVTARSKGLTRRRVVGRHALSNALIPLITVMAVQLPALFGGAVVIEQMFAWPGMGRMALDAVNTRNYPIILGFVMFVSILVLLSNLAADVMYAIVDPRVRTGQEES